MLLPGQEGSPSPQLGSEGTVSGAHQGCRKDELSEHLAGLNYDRLCCPQPADSGLALWLAIRSWDSDSHSGVMDLGVGVRTTFLLLARSPCPPYECCYGSCGTRLCCLLPYPLPVAEPHGRCAACGLSKPAGTCTGLSHTGLCRSRGYSTCSRGGVMSGPEGGEGPSLPLFPLGNLHLGSHRWVTLMGLGAE